MIIIGDFNINTNEAINNRHINVNNFQSAFYTISRHPYLINTPE